MDVKQAIMDARCEMMSHFSDENQLFSQVTSNDEADAQDEDGEAQLFPDSQDIPPIDLEESQSAASTDLPASASVKPATTSMDELRCSSASSKLVEPASALSGSLEPAAVQPAPGGSHFASDAPAAVKPASAASALASATDASATDVSATDASATDASASAIDEKSNSISPSSADVQCASNAEEEAVVDDADATEIAMAVASISNENDNNYFNFDGAAANNAFNLKDACAAAKKRPIASKPAYLSMSSPTTSTSNPSNVSPPPPTYNPPVSPISPPPCNSTATVDSIIEMANLEATSLIKVRVQKCQGYVV